VPLRSVLIDVVYGLFKRFVRGDRLATIRVGLSTAGMHWIKAVRGVATMGDTGGILPFSCIGRNFIAAAFF
jgi:hypothetical protein